MYKNVLFYASGQKRIGLPAARSRRSHYASDRTPGAAAAADGLSAGASDGGCSDSRDSQVAMRWQKTLTELYGLLVDGIALAIEIQALPYHRFFRICPFVSYSIVSGNYASKVVHYYGISKQNSSFLHEITLYGFVHLRTFAAVNHQTY